MGWTGIISSVWRSLFLLMGGALSTLLLFIPVLLVSLFEREGKGVHFIGRIWSRIILFLAGVEVEVEGLERIPNKGPYIIVSNHQGAFDIPVIQGYLPIQFRWVSKVEAFRYPVIGWAMRLAGYIHVDRGHLKGAYRSLEAMEKKLQEGFPVLVFPEGTRQEREEVGPFKRGAFIVARKTGVPILPIAIRGTKKITESLPRIQPSRVRVRIESPLDPKGLDERRLMARAFSIIKEGFDSIDQPIKKG